MTDVRAETIVTYLGAMERGDLNMVCACFTPDAIVQSPVYGEMLVRPFYQQLFDDTVKVEISVRQIYCGRDSTDSWVAHFAYKWQRKSGEDIDTHLIDLFDFVGDRIARLRIIFDSVTKR